MIGICAPYTRSETTLAASMVAAALCIGGNSVRWFVEGEPAEDVKLGWSAYLERPCTRGKQLAKNVSCWIYFSVASDWCRASRKSPAAKHLLFRDWRQYSARWSGRKISRMITADESQPAYRQNQRARYDFIRWSSGLPPVQQPAPRANKSVSVLVFLDRHSSCHEFQECSRAVHRWLAAGCRVLLCTWNTSSSKVERHWQNLMGENAKFEWHRKPSFAQLKVVAAECDTCVLSQRSTAYGAWVVFFRSLGLWTVGNEMRVTKGLLDESIGVAKASGNKVLASNLWTVYNPKRMLPIQRVEAHRRSQRDNEQFSEYWNEIWTPQTP
jgi:hypothetical protein